MSNKLSLVSTIKCDSYVSKELKCTSGQNQRWLWAAYKTQHIFYYGVLDG